MDRTPRRRVPEDPLNNIAHSLRQISDSLRTLRADHAPRLHVGRAQTTVAVKPDLATGLAELQATVEKLTNDVRFVGGPAPAPGAAPPQPAPSTLSVCGG